MLTAARPQAAPPREDFLGDMFLRLERLEAEVSRLRASAERPGTEVFEAQDWDAPDAGHSRHEDGSSTETRPEICLGAPTPPENPWPAPRPSPRDTPWPANPPDPDHDLLRVAFDLHPHAVVAVDGLGLVRLWNRAAVALFGWPADEAVGSPPPFLPADRREEHASLVRSPRSVLPGQELATVRRNRLSEPVAVRLSVTESRCGGVVFTLRPDAAPADGTPDPRPAMPPTPATGEAIDLVGDRSAGAMVTLGRAAAGVAHDFNNLLTAVLGSAGLLRERLDAADADSHDLATDIVTAAELAGAMCRDLVAVARYSPGTPAQTDLSSHVLRYRRLLGKLAGSHTAIRLDLADGLAPGQIPQAEFAQVLLNLAQNAAESMEPAGGTLTIATSAETVGPGWPGHAAPGRYVVLTVSDRGPGVGLNRDAASLRDLCRPGVPARPDALGLAVVADILARHGGHLTLEADAATGTSFRVAFREA